MDKSLSEKYLFNLPKEKPHITQKKILIGTDSHRLVQKTQKAQKFHRRHRVFLYALGITLDGLYIFGRPWRSKNLSHLPPAYTWLNSYSENSFYALQRWFR